MDKSTIGKGIGYLYIEAIVMLFSGYIYWLLLSQITTPTIIGTSSTVVSFVTIFSTVASVGITSGMQRFLGKSITQKKDDETRIFTSSALLLSMVGILGSIVLLFVLRELVYQYFRFDLGILLIAILIMVLTVMSSLLRAVLIPTMKTRVITVSSILGTIIKIFSTVFLILLGFGVLGVLIGFMLYPLVSLIFLAISVKSIIYKKRIRTNLDLSLGILKSIRHIFVASFSFWVPSVITTIGSQLGTITVFVSSGAGQAGLYFIAFSIVTGITIIMSVLSTVAYPVVSSMSNGRKRGVWRLIKISILVTLPLSNALIFYSKDLMQLFGASYTLGASSLSILLLSILPTAIITGISVLAYAYGKNGYVLIIGLCTSIPRTIMYFIFVPILGGTGAAVTFLLGAIIGCAASLIVARKIDMKINWRDLILIFSFPIIISIPLKIIDISPLMSILLILIVSYLIYWKLHFIAKEDIQDIIRVIPPQIVNQVLKVVSRIHKSERK